MRSWLFLSVNTILQPWGWTLGLSRQPIFDGADNGWAVYRAGPVRLGLYRFPRG
jgi:hypothetical protein